MEIISQYTYTLWTSNYNCVLVIEQPFEVLKLFFILVKTGEYTLVRKPRLLWKLMNHWLTSRGRVLTGLY